MAISRNNPCRTPNGQKETCNSFGSLQYLREFNFEKVCRVKFELVLVLAYYKYGSNVNNNPKLYTLTPTYMVSSHRCPQHDAR